MAEYKIVPVEPTEEMVVAGCRHENMGDMAGRYNAMLNAAPPIPDEAVERMARWLCTEAGRRPDETMGGPEAADTWPTWALYQGKAEVLIKAMEG